MPFPQYGIMSVMKNIGISLTALGGRRVGTLVAAPQILAEVKSVI